MKTSLVWVVGPRRHRLLCLAGLLWGCLGVAQAQTDLAPREAPAALQVTGVLPAPPAGVAELRFGELFKRPVGPRGLEPTARLLALDGQSVRLVGYMAAAALPMAGRLILAPLPTTLGDEDEALADDLPAQAVFVHLSGPAALRTLPNYRGLIQLHGRLSVGALDEPDGHRSAVRLLLDGPGSLALLPPAPGVRPPP